MSLTQTDIEYKIEIESNGIIFIRSSYQVFNDDVLIATPVHRDSYTPDMEISSLPDLVKPYAQLVWTTELVEKYKQNLAV